MPSSSPRPRQRRESLLALAASNASTESWPLALLRTLLRLAHEEWGTLDEVPKIRLEKEGEGRLRWLKPEEAQRLLDAARASRNAELIDLIELALFTGMRQAEVLKLAWDRVDRARGVVLLEVTKSGRRREVPPRGHIPEPERDSQNPRSLWRASAVSGEPRL
jgi:integrase